MSEDMRIRGMSDKVQKSHIRAVKDFARFLERSSDTATPEELRANQLNITDTGVTVSTFNTRIVALRFFFDMTCGREDMRRFMQFRTQPRKLPVVLSVEEVSDILMATPGRASNIVQRSAFPMALVCARPRFATLSSAT
jgi:site-specific recombinase XerD